MPRERDQDSGRYVSSVTVSAILETLEGTRLGTSEVAERIGCHRSTAYTKLRELENQGQVEATHVGNTLVWETVNK